MSDQGAKNRHYGELRQSLLPIVLKIDMKIHKWYGEGGITFLQNTCICKHGKSSWQVFKYFWKQCLFREESFQFWLEGKWCLIITVRKAWLFRVRSGVSLLRPPQEKGVKIKLTIFRGQSFNYFFYAAGATYQHLADIKTILDS